MSSEVEHITHTPYLRRPDQDALYRVAEGQGGYFTTRQARGAGYSRSLLAHHARTGQFLHARHGVYRLARFPSSGIEDLYATWLEVGERAVVSHDSALALYGLSDLIPSEIHLTVPRTNSRRHAHVRLHTSALAADETTRREGLPVTTVARTIADLATAGLADELLDQAVREALDRGLITRRDLESQRARRRGRAKRMIERALDESGSP
jgi:predicted transcriptional regulator of viral defense system